MFSRDFPYIWPTWISGLLSGDKDCEYAAWYRAHYQDYNKRSDGFDFAKWKEDHTALLKQDRAQMTKEGFKVFTEGQNAFTWKGKQANIGGKPDTVSIRSTTDHRVHEYKTGKTRDSDMMQVKIYLCALPRTLDRHVGRTLEGEVVYGTRNETGQMVVRERLEVPSHSVDLAFKDRLVQLVGRVASPHQARPVPSEGECRFCDLANCEYRWKLDPATEGEAWF